MKFFTSIFFLLIPILLLSQEVEPLVVDTSVNHVKRAVVLSAILPGAGQVYNSIHAQKGQRKAYWKVPLIYAGLGTTGYFLFSNQTTLMSLKREYQARIDGTNELNQEWMLYDDQGVLTLYQQHANRRDLSIMAFGLVYLFQIADAGVEAHFLNFDISEDLSMKAMPVILSQNTLGMQLSFKFR